MNRLLFVVGLLFSIASSGQQIKTSAWIRINQLGYVPSGVKVAVLCSKQELVSQDWKLIDVVSGKSVTNGAIGKNFGNYGPFQQTYRLNFSTFKNSGKYYLQSGEVKSPEFEIGDDVYKGAADFCLRYMRQQRSGFNPFLKDSCHTHDGYVLYGENAGIKDSSHIDVVGGWHEASDYLQYSSTSANATYHLLAAYRDFPKAFGDEKLANGLEGKNGVADVLDEAKWGLDWLMKMHPRPDWMFNQIGDDRDHMGMRIPKEDTNYYGKGLERPVYFINGEPQQRGKFMNNTTGTSSTAAKFASAFALGNLSFLEFDKEFAKKLFIKAKTAYNFSKIKKGVTQTASVRSPYIYAEENWLDDVELAQASMALMELDDRNNAFECGNQFDGILYYSQLEKITPWFGRDTASHYQWYPFINVGHYELAQLSKKWEARFIKSKVPKFRYNEVINYYKKGIELVWNKAEENAFYRGIPFIWCSNNLTTSFAIQCYWYKQLTADNSFDELEQANFDWLFGCNPWGTSMVYGLPSWGDTPVDPHSAFTHLKNYPIDGGLVDGPVYGSIYNNLIGITLFEPDEYAAFQSNLAVYHDDYGDYSTNEPTMDGTASLIYLLAAKAASSPLMERGMEVRGAVVRGDTSQKNIAIVFTGHEFAEGGNFIAQTLKNEGIKASFFFTGDFYRNKKFSRLIKQLKTDGHYLGAHSDKHLLYCDWKSRDSLLISKSTFEKDLKENYKVMHRFGIASHNAQYFLPPYEWYNDSIAIWTKELGLQLVNYSPGTLSNADYTTPNENNYRSSKTIYNSIIDFEESSTSGFNGFILLLHCGAGEKRTDKFYKLLPKLIKVLKTKGYQFQRVDELFQ